MLFGSIPIPEDQGRDIDRTYGWILRQMAAQPIEVQYMIVLAIVVIISALIWSYTRTNRTQRPF